MFNQALRNKDARDRKIRLDEIANNTEIKHLKELASLELDYLSDYE